MAFDSWFFCHQITEAARAKGFDWVTQAESNRIVHCKGQKMNVTQLAESLPEKRFKTVKIKGEAYVLCGLKAWMPKAGNVRLVVFRAEDGFHFIVSNRVGRDVKQNLGLEEYQLRKGRGAITHWHLIFNAYTFLTLLRQSVSKTSTRLGKCLIRLGDVCRWVKRQCFRRLVD